MVGHMLGVIKHPDSVCLTLHSTDFLCFLFLPLFFFYRFIYLFNVWLYFFTYFLQKWCIRWSPSKELKNLLRRILSNSQELAPGLRTKNILTYSGWKGISIFMSSLKLMFQHFGYLRSLIINKVSIVMPKLVEKCVSGKKKVSTSTNT